MTNTEYLMKALGWQGGTVHQVASDTGLTVMEVLDLHTFPISNVIAHGHGLKAVKMCVVDICGAPYSTCGYKPDRISFWRGVLDAQKAQK